MNGWTRKFLYAACAVTFLSSAPLGCANGDDTTLEEPGDSKWDSFMADGKADAFGIAEGTPEAVGILQLANTASLSELDDDVALDVRAAENIVNERTANGDIQTLQALDDVAWVGSRAFGKLYEYARSNGYISGEQPTGELVHGVAEGSPEADAILHLTNTATLQTLDDDVALDARAAQNIVDHRAQSEIGSLTELDSISYVSSQAFEKLLHYVTANGLVQDDDPTAPRPGESTDPFDDTFCQGGPITSSEARAQFAYGSNYADIGEGTWHVRQRTCNDVTGCGAWSLTSSSQTTDLKLRTNSNGEVMLDVDNTPLANETSVYDSNPVTEDLVTVTAKRRVNYNTTYRRYRGQVADHCLRLSAVEDTNPDNTSSWTETEYVLAHRFDPTPGTRVEPQETAQDSPFHDASCEGSTIALSEAKAHFGYGEDYADIGTGNWHTRKRTCNEFSGCGDWSLVGSPDPVDASLLVNSNSEVVLSLNKTTLANETSVYDSNPVTDNEITVTAKRRVNYNTTYRRYRGKMTQSCLRLNNVTESSKDNSSNWTETQYVYELAVDPDPTARDNPPADTPSSSPFSADSCSGSTITGSEAASHFQPGSAYASIGAGDWQRRVRQCNNLTGCGDWEITQSGTSADATLKVNSNSEIVLGLSRTLLPNETSVYDSNPVTDNQITVTAKRRVNYNTTYRRYRGHMTNSCVYLSTTFESSEDNRDSYTETQEAFGLSL